LPQQSRTANHSIVLTDCSTIHRRRLLEITAGARFPLPTLSFPSPLIPALSSPSSPPFSPSVPPLLPLSLSFPRPLPSCLPLPFPLFLPLPLNEARGTAVSSPSGPKGSGRQTHLVHFHFQAKINANFDSFTGSKIYRTIPVGAILGHRPHNFLAVGRYGTELSLKPNWVKW